MDIDVIERLEQMISNERNPRKRVEMRQVLAETLKKLESKTAS